MLLVLVELGLMDYHQDQRCMVKKKVCRKY
jgi:hypothetical protein